MHLITASIKQRGYTLIEMLVSVSIFSGLLIIVLGTVASSSSSSAKVSLLRDKNQAARALIDQISNDFRYVDKAAVFEDKVVLPCKTRQDGSCLYQGYSIAPNRLVLALHLPNTDPATQIVRKEYNIEVISSRLTLTLREGRQCRINVSSILICDQQSNPIPIDLLSTAYVLNDGLADWPSSFGGLTVDQGQGATPSITPFLTISLTIKPVGFRSLSCRDIDPGNCYKVSTTLSLGSTS